MVLQDGVMALTQMDVNGKFSFVLVSLAMITACENNSVLIFNKTELSIPEKYEIEEFQVEQEGGYDADNSAVVFIDVSGEAADSILHKLDAKNHRGIPGIEFVGKKYYSEERFEDTDLKIYNKERKNGSYTILESDEFHDIVRIYDFRGARVVVCNGKEDGGNFKRCMLTLFYEDFVVDFRAENINEKELFDIRYEVEGLVNGWHRFG